MHRFLVFLGPTSYRYFTVLLMYVFCVCVLESQSEISIAEQDLRKARDAKQDFEKKMKVLEEEKVSLEREIQDLRDKYMSQARELKEAVAKQKIAIEQYTDSNDS